MALLDIEPRAEDIPLLVEHFVRRFRHATGKAIEGLSRHASVHAAGVVIAPGPLDEYVPVCRDTKNGGQVITQYDMIALEKAGMLKMDFLGLRTLTVIHDAEGAIHRRHGVDIDWDAIGLDDPDVYAMLATGGTRGVFQFESGGMADLLMKLRPDRLEDLIAANALFRPGPMALIAMLFALVISLPLGIYAARHQNQPGDVTVMFGTQLGLATPEFWFGILLTLLFSVQLGWFSAGGFPGWQNDFWGSIKALLLPAFALGVIRASILTRLTRSSMLEVLREDYVRTARAKGLKERTVVYVHALRNALVPVLTIMGLQLGQLLAGAIIIENVYFLPGLGRLVFNAIGQRDLPVVRDIVLFMAMAVVAVNFIVDLAYASLDPRIRLQ